MMNIKMRFPGFKYKAFTLSYDDGVTQDIRLLQIMEKYGVKGTFNINSGLFGYGKRMVADNLPTLYENQEVAVHGHKHLSLQGLDTGMICQDIIKDRELLETLFNRVIKGMAYAYGTYDETVLNTLKACGISYSRTTYNTDDFSLPKDWLQWHTTCHHNSPKLMEYAEKFLAVDDGDYARRTSEPKLFFVWGHSSEFDDNDNWEVIENLLKKVGGKDDIWYATNGEIYEYTENFRKLQFSADGKLVYNPTAQDMYMVAGGKEVVAKAGATTRTTEE